MWRSQIALRYVLMVACWSEVDRWAQKYRRVRLDAGRSRRLCCAQNWRNRAIPDEYVRRVDGATPSRCRAASASVRPLSAVQG